MGEKMACIGSVLVTYISGENTKQWPSSTSTYILLPNKLTRSSNKLGKDLEYNIKRPEFHNQ
jgi:hypothetical protein